MTQKLKISYTKLSFYLACPKRYYYRYIEKRPYYPSTMTKYGSNIHRTLKDFSEIMKEGEDLDFAAQKSLLEHQWTSVSKDESKNLELKELGVKQLQEFYEKNKETMGNTLFLEKSFNFPMEDIILNGFIDRVDLIEENKAEIIDYKTGRIRELFPDDIQLNFYALICRDYFLLTPAKLSLYFLKMNEKTSVSADNDHIDRTKALILQIAENIRSNNFSPDLIEPHVCYECCYRRVCPISVN